METVLTCPLGHTCIDARDGKLYRCRWYLSMKHTAADGTETEYDECALVVHSIHLSELKGNTRGVQAAVESFRNNVEESQKRLTESGMRRKQIPVSVS